MNSTRIIQFAASLEEILDTRLFREQRPEDNESVNGHKTVAGLGKAAAAGVGAAAISHGGAAAHGAVMKRHGERALLNTGSSVLGSHNAGPASGGGTVKVGAGEAYRSAAQGAVTSVKNRAQAGLRAGIHAGEVRRANGMGVIRSTGYGVKKGLKVAAAPLLKRIAQIAR